MPAPRRGSSAGRAAMLTMRPPLACMRATAARQQRKALTRFIELRHQRGLAGLGDRPHGEAAGDVDRGPERVGAAIDRFHRRLVGETAGRDEAEPLVAAMAVLRRLGGDDEGHMAGGAALEQRADNGGTERTGATGDDDRAIAEIHGTASLSEVDEPTASGMMAAIPGHVTTGGA